MTSEDRCGAADGFAGAGSGRLWRRREVLLSDAWSLDLARAGAFRAGETFSLRLAQPLRVRVGGYLLNLPTAYDYAGLAAATTPTLYALAPHGRKLDVEAAYAVPLLGRGTLSAHTYLRRQPGHVAAAPNDLGAAIRMSFDF